MIRVEVDGEGLPNRESVTYLDVVGPKGDKQTLQKPFKFNAGAAGTPHAQIEFELDATALGVPATQKGKAELEEGDYLVQARVPKEKKEVFQGKEHASDAELPTVQGHAPRRRPERGGCGGDRRRGQRDDLAIRGRH